MSAKEIDYDAIPKTMPDDIIGVATLNDKDMEAIDFLKNEGETIVDVFRRALHSLAFFQTEANAGYTQMFLRNPKKQTVKPIKIVAEEGEDGKGT